MRNKTGYLTDAEATVLCKMLVATIDEIGMLPTLDNVQYVRLEAVHEAVTTCMGWVEDGSLVPPADDLPHARTLLAKVQRRYNNHVSVQAGLAAGLLP